MREDIIDAIGVGLYYTTLFVIGFCLGYFIIGPLLS